MGHRALRPQRGGLLMAALQLAGVRADAGPIRSEGRHPVQRRGRDRVMGRWSRGAYVGLDARHDRGDDLFDSGAHLHGIHQPCCHGSPVSRALRWLSRDPVLRPSAGKLGAVEVCEERAGFLKYAVETRHL